MEKGSRTRTKSLTWKVWSLAVLFCKSSSRIWPAFHGAMRAPVPSQTLAGVLEESDSTFRHMLGCFPLLTDDVERPLRVPSIEELKEGVVGGFLGNTSAGK